MARAKSDAAPDLGAAVLQEVAKEPASIYDGYPEPSYEPNPGVTLKALDIVITRDMSTTIPATVYFHELPAVYAIHGQDNVQVVREYEVTLDRFSPVDEFHRIKNRYDRRNLKVVDEAYRLRGPEMVAELAGVEVEGGRAVQTKASSQTIRSREGQVRKFAA